jgi:hypothetical protein
MKLRSGALGALVGLCLSVSVMHAAAAADRPYTEGTVTDVASVRTQPGMFDEYMAWLAGPWKQQMEAQKAAGIIVDYGIYSATPRGPNDPDLYLITVYKNMAALDDLDAKLDPIYEKLTGTLAVQNKQFAERSRLRTILGDELIREVKLK